MLNSSERDLQHFLWPHVIVSLAWSLHAGLRIRQPGSMPWLSMQVLMTWFIVEATSCDSFHAFKMWRPAPCGLTSNPVKMCCLLICEFVITPKFTGSNKTNINNIIRFCNIPQSLYNGQQTHSNVREDVLQIHPNARDYNKMKKEIK